MIAIDVAVTLDPMGAPTVIVSRDGCDMDPELLHAVFLAHRAGDAYARAHEKAGLGLSSARDLVEAHGGSIRAVSHRDQSIGRANGRRTELIITLPASRLMPPAR